MLMFNFDNNTFFLYSYALIQGVPYFLSYQGIITSQARIMGHPVQNIIICKLVNNGVKNLQLYI